MTRHLLLALLLAVALTTAACGGGSSTDDAAAQRATFKRGFAAVDAQIKRTGDGLGTALQQAGHISDATLLRRLVDLRGQLNGEIAQPTRLRPPTSQRPQLNRLVGSLRPVSGALTEAISAIRARDVAAGRRAGADLVASALKVKPAANALRRALGLRVTP